MFDSLTGLRNRHHLEEALHTQMNLAVRNNSPLSCLMIDIDHFKAVNDNYGHEAGDLVIKTSRRSSSARYAILAAFRYGGEEFWCCFPAAMRPAQKPARLKSTTT